MFGHRARPAGRPIRIGDLDKNPSKVLLMGVGERYVVRPNGVRVKVLILDPNAVNSSGRFEYLLGYCYNDNKIHARVSHLAALLIDEAYRAFVLFAQLLKKTDTSAEELMGLCTNAVVLDPDPKNASARQQERRVAAMVGPEFQDIMGLKIAQMPMIIQDYWRRRP